MADQKKWFKVWGSILVDPSLSSLTLADMGRWVRLGAYMTTCGNRGKLVICNPAKVFLLAMDVDSIAAAKVALKRLPNVQISDCQNDNGSFIVTMRNWYKYQVDYTVGERVKRLRDKKRGEERRREETPKPPFAGATSTANGNSGFAKAKALLSQGTAPAKRFDYDVPEHEIMGPDEFAKIKAGIGQKTHEPIDPDVF